MIVVFCVVSLFLYFILYAFTLPEYGRPPDYSWLKVSTMCKKISYVDCKMINI